MSRPGTGVVLLYSFMITTENTMAKLEHIRFASINLPEIIQYGRTKLDALRSK